MASVHDVSSITVEGFRHNWTSNGPNEMRGYTHHPRHGEDDAIEWSASPADHSGKRWTIFLLSRDGTLPSHAPEVLRNLQENAIDIFTHFKWVNENVNEAGQVYA
ncbi:hypothetical protein COU13_01195 [Candidatus Kaiserbacteria bacterium CG10_big_fil_rev_8_21_14_0_10_43_70]|uniref:Uncharacterized protein n=1 Tax=Candidatus Kaiserbacteria bacterium CG10_big_fil_rev_8_21_14_0_10_43_70 TaxID=1974605 RepID=A0A2H0UJ33_9BACT|nr:MAG: hypothetical protein COU13_01195 [Candidatus Kaiserbacteria bacterium CG10_big_fil_rev_8_21_14_0_10_43_70]